MKTIIDLFEEVANKYPKKTAIKDNNESLTYEELQLKAKKMSGAISLLKGHNEPVAIFLERTVRIPVAMLSVLYSGNFYLVLDAISPVDRLSKIIQNVNPIAIITDSKHYDMVDKYSEGNVPLIVYDLSVERDIDDDAIGEIKEKIILSDPACAITTSGSTGFPKTVLLSELNILSYIDWFASRFQIDENTIFGSQTPFYFSMSVSDFYGTILKGGTYVMIPKLYFTFAASLVSYLNENKVNVIYWVPSAYGILMKYDLLSDEKFQCLKTALFAGETMPVKYLNYLKSHSDVTTFANLFGPTETTDICSYYVVDRSFLDSETLPIGKPCEGVNNYVIDESGRESDQGELCVSGTFVAMGYWNNSEVTKERFTPNPLRLSYPEIIYHTGDLVKKMPDGNLIHIGRIDNQIKRMGYRIELGEIESVIRGYELIDDDACVFVNNHLIAYYMGRNIKSEELKKYISKKLPEYMRPDEMISLSAFPLNANGKIDRKALSAMAEKEKK